MSTLEHVWQAASGRPFEPLIGKNRQFVLGFTLLLTGTLCISECSKALLMVLSMFNHANILNCSLCSYWVFLAEYVFPTDHGCLKLLVAMASQPVSC